MTVFYCGKQKKTVDSNSCYKCYFNNKKEFESRIYCKAKNIVLAEGEVVEPLIKELKETIYA